MENKFDVIVLGGGPAGLTAGIYLGRSKAKTVIIDTGMPGGQMVLTYEIANYPGIESISGYQLASAMKKQAKNFSCVIKSNIKLKNLILEGDEKKVELENGEVFTAPAIILSTGGRSRTLNVPGEDTFKGRGISYCATCDGDFFQDKEIIVVGGGNSALEEAVALTKYARKVTILHEFDHFQAFEHAVEEAKANPKIDYIMGAHITEFFGKESLEGIKYKNLKTGEIFTKKIDGVFIFVGYEANTQALENTPVKLNQWNEIETDENLQTNIKGVFAAGDCRAKRFRQITTAVADGTVSALNALNYIQQ
ncbi:FAD-dependent oxidoreductase [Candidatus Sulfidibacterium hydrothermale]|uniref:NAD(P)/FAD-dependent oxidoreductase n=1 Tax=Candidatus Sulfidibacterium hydrothermale TaxID=2875962 RepID=UPI001F0ACCC7|nr:FAD-dependent oxidoreductase [Candidatus Sulfidibacterium hydrothermale]UBM63548.1 FAD-dependent oxidoreductase [Candidatus Sulfidibacterium hydrothermale]